MVDVGQKEPTRRTATASGRIVIPRIAYELVTGGRVEDDARESPTNADAASFRKAQEKARSKGDVLTVAQLAAIMGCKRTAELIPLCHPLQLSHIAVTLHPDSRTASDAPKEAEADFVEGTRSDVGLGQSSARLTYSIMCRATVSCEGKTGVEMEALTAVSVGLLTVWDMLKAVAGKEMIIQDILVEQKAGGRSGSFMRSFP